MALALVLVLMGRGGGRGGVSTPVTGPGVGGGSGAGVADEKGEEGGLDARLGMGGGGVLPLETGAAGDEGGASESVEGRDSVSIDGRAGGRGG